MGYELRDDELAVVLKPLYDENGNLMSFRTGLAIGNSVGDEEAVGQLMMDAALNMAASLMYMESYPEFEDVLEDLKVTMLKEMFPDQYAEAEAEIEAEEQAAKEAYGDNVVNLKWWTKTQGNA
jgi:hypothetical protein